MSSQKNIVERHVKRGNGEPRSTHGFLPPRVPRRARRNVSSRKNIPATTVRGVKRTVLSPAVINQLGGGGVTGCVF